MYKCIRILDRASENPAMSSNGGDYDYGRTLLVNDNGQVVAGRCWTSADFPYCPICGTFGDCDCIDGWDDNGHPIPTRTFTDIDTSGGEEYPEASGWVFSTQEAKGIWIPI